MVYTARQSNYDILGIREGSSLRDVRDAFRRKALELHSDRGGKTAEFIRIRQAYEDLKEGKMYPDTPSERLRNSRVYQGDSNQEIKRRNEIIGREIHAEVREASSWANAAFQCGISESRMFGSKTLGEMEFEVQKNGLLLIKGNYMAGQFAYDGPVVLQGNVSSPSWSDKYRSRIITKHGNLKLLDPIKNHYRIENGASLTSLNGHVIAGNVYGRKYKVEDPDGRVGIYTIREYRTHLHAPKGHVVVENASDTVLLEGNTVVVLNMEHDVRISAQHVLIYGNHMTYDCTIHLKQNGTLRFFENQSILGLSDDSVIELENGRRLHLRSIKSHRIHDIPGHLLEDKDQYHRKATMVGGGFKITYDILNTL